MINVLDALKVLSVELNTETRRSCEIQNWYLLTIKKLARKPKIATRTAPKNNFWGKILNSQYTLIRWSQNHPGRAPIAYFIGLKFNQLTTKLGSGRTDGRLTDGTTS